LFNRDEFYNENENKQKGKKRLLPAGITWWSIERNPGTWSVPGMKTNDGLYICLHTCVYDDFF